jgi:hypothetical protein
MIYEQVKKKNFREEVRSRLSVGHYSQQELRHVTLSDWRGNAELLVYLVDEEKDIYIGVHRFATQDLSAESFQLHRDS